MNNNCKNKIILLKKQCETYLFMDSALNGGSYYRDQAEKCLETAKGVLMESIQDQTKEVNTLDHLNQEAA